MRLKRKEIRLTDEEHYFCGVLQKVYKINASNFIREAFIEKLKNDIPEIRKEFAKKYSRNCPF